MNNIVAFCIGLNLLFTGTALFGQNFTLPDATSKDAAFRERDSLKLTLQSALDDTSRARIMVLLSENFGSSWSNTDSIIRFAEAALLLMDKIEINPSWKARACRMLGRGYRRNENLLEGLRLMFKALRIAQDAEDKRMTAIILNDIGSVYNVTGYSYSEAEKYYAEAMALSKTIDDKAISFMCYFNLGLNSYNRKEYKQALTYFLDGYNVGYNLSQLDTGVVYYQLGNCYLKLGKLDEAEGELQKALMISKKVSMNKPLMGQCYISLGAVYLRRADALKKNNSKYAEAIDYLTKGISLVPVLGRIHVRREGYAYLAEAYAKVKNYEKAMLFTNRYVLLNDSIMSIENKRQIEQLKVQNEIDRANLQEKEHENKRKQEASRLKSIFLSGILVVCVISVLFFLLIRQRNLKQRAIEKIKTAQRITALELESLRAQLNPHFMFNSLTAIQELILKEDIDNSHLYLARFSELLRTLLDNANQPFISLKKEINLQQLYLSLERLRIRDLHYSIDLDPSIDASNITIPNMMLQPYLENAIWHGLSPKQGEKILKISICKKDSELIFSVEDNGVGRKKAEEMKSLYRKEHRSKGMELLSRRFKLLSKEYGSAIETKIEDLYNNGYAMGTRIEISVPYSLAEHRTPVYS